MKTFMITAPQSNTGKTTLTSGIIRALVNRGYSVNPFKTGPDYIDGQFHAVAASRLSGNLDLHMQGKEGVYDALTMQKGDFAVIEGVMGYFDGKANTFEQSSYDLSVTLDIPAVLVYTPKGEMFSAVPKIKGMADFQDSKIQAVILNKVSEKMYHMLKEAIETYTKVKVIGYIPYEAELDIGTKGLGLLLPEQIQDFEQKIERMAQLVENYVDVDQLITLAKDLSIESNKQIQKRPIRVAIAKDQAFCFHYRENLSLFEQMANVTYFSPLEDEKLPDVDLVWLGGGYPEQHKEALSSNSVMRDAIQSFVKKGGYILAEGAGLMVLMQALDGVPMWGLLEGTVQMTEKLSRFGYIFIELEADCILGKKGDIIPANEYHRSELTTEMAPIFHVTKPASSQSWSCGYQKDQILAYYPHINFAGKEELLLQMFDNILERQS